MLLGLVMVPYPGPGWLVVFAGFAILATEFDWAHRLRMRMHGYYQRWHDWMARQPMYLRIVSLCITGLVVTVTVWLLNGFGYANDFLQLGFDWARSPIPWFY